MGTTTARAPARERWSWALYDFATTLFSMNVTTLYFAVWLVSDLHVSNTAVAIGNGVASALVMVVVPFPIFGALSDVTLSDVSNRVVIGFTRSMRPSDDHDSCGWTANEIPLVGDATHHFPPFPLQ